MSYNTLGDVVSSPPKPQRLKSSSRKSSASVQRAIKLPPMAGVKRKK